MKKHYNNGSQSFQRFIILGLIILLTFIAIKNKAIFADSIIGTNLSTTGTLSVTGTSTFSSDIDLNLGATSNLKIDATTIDHTDDTEGIIQINLDASASNDGAMGIFSNVTNKNGNAYSNWVHTYTSETALLANQQYSGSQNIMTGNASDGSGSSYIGNRIASGGTNGGGADYRAFDVAFSSDAMAADMIGNGNIRILRGETKKTTGSGTVGGVDLILKNESASTTDLFGLSIDMTASGAGDIASDQGIRISNSGTGTMSAGIYIGGSNANAFTSAIDASDDDIINALNTGINPILMTAQNAPATCSAGQIVIDNGGATTELCFCVSTDTWECTALAAGPTD